MRNFHNFIEPGNLVYEYKTKTKKIRCINSPQVVNGHHGQIGALVQRTVSKYGDVHVSVIRLWVIQQCYRLVPNIQWILIKLHVLDVIYKLLNAVAVAVVSVKVVSYDFIVVLQNIHLKLLSITFILFRNQDKTIK